jgi:hypothetical protein
VPLEGHSSGAPLHGALWEEPCVYGRAAKGSLVAVGVAAGLAHALGGLAAALDAVHLSGLQRVL